MILTESRKLFHWRRVKRNRKEYQVCKQVLVYTAFGLGATTVQAGPTGGEITSGSGTITQAGTTTDILQATQRLDINWETFSSLPEETINFLQPNSMAVAINRVIGGVPSSLEGALNANGRVFILNQAGIVFHQSGSVNVAGLLATTAENVDVDGDVWNFSGTGYGAVLNHGQINISNGGFAVLAAPHVQNTGGITANLGQIQLASTNTYTMDLRGDGLITFSIPDEAVQQIAADGQALGVDNTGTLQARSGVVGMTAKTASDLVTGAVNLSGVIDADSFDTGMDGGQVQLVSKGDINFTGSATVSVNGGIDGDGGEIKTWADGVNRFTAGATLSARGGDEAGDGGFIELSGNTVRVRGNIDAAAPNGEAGTFLLDPDVIIIAQGNGDSASLNTGTAIATANATSAETGFTVFEEKIEAITFTGVHVILEADDLITMQDLFANSGDGILDVYSGGITLRILDDADNIGRIEFQNLNNMIRGTTGDITIEVNGDNTAGVGAEIEIGNLRTGAFTGSTGIANVADAGDIFINAPSGTIKVGAITILASTNDPSPGPDIVTAPARADLTIIAGEDITITGPVSISANRFDNTVAIANLNAGAYANITVSTGYIDIQNDFSIEANVEAGGSALLAVSLVNVDANFFAGTDITIDGDLNVSADFLNNGGLAQAADIFVDLNMIAGGGVALTGVGDITIGGNLNAQATIDVRNPGQRAAASVNAYLLAANDVSVYGTTDADGFAGIDIRAVSKNGNANADDPGRTLAVAHLDVYAGYGGNSGSINVSSGVNIFGSAITRGQGKLPTTAEANANLFARDDITIDGDLFVTALAETRLANPANDGSAFAYATLFVGAGFAGTGDLYVGGDAAILASVDKNGVQERGYAGAYASADIYAAKNVTFDGELSVTANARTINGIALYGTNVAYANLSVFAGLSSGTSGEIIVGDGVSVVASADISGLGYAGYVGNVNAFAYAEFVAPYGVQIGDPVYGGGITVQADAHNNITNTEMHSASAHARLDIAVNDGDITIHGPVLVSADADKVYGSGDASAFVNANLQAYSYIDINGDFTVAADAFIGSLKSNGL